MKKYLTLLIAAAMCAVCAMAQTAATYDNTRLKAERFFAHNEWASAAAMYNFMLRERPDVPDTYGRAIVANAFLGDTLRQMQLFTDAMSYAVPLDSVLASVRRYSFEKSDAAMYEHFLLDVAAANPWLERPVDAYLLRYYDGRGNGPKIVAYADKMLAGTPDNTQFLALRARGLMIDGRTEQAVATWRRILELQPANYDALLCLANYCRLQGDCAEALPYFERARDVRPTPYVDSAIKDIKSKELKTKH